MRSWIGKHSRLSAIVGVIVAIAGALATIQEIWNLFNSKPFFPYISTSVPIWPKILLSIVFVIITGLGLGILVRVFQITKREASPTWLGQVLKDDLEKVKVIRHDWYLYFDGLKNTDPYFDLIINMVNANVYAVTITEVEGRFLIEGQECAYPTELCGTSRILHGETTGIRFRQRISQEMKKFIISRAQPPGNLAIQVHTCKIMVKCEVEGHESAVLISLGPPPIQAYVGQTLQRYILDSQS